MNKSSIVVNEVIYEVKFNVTQHYYFLNDFALGSKLLEANDCFFLHRKPASPEINLFYRI